MNVLTKPMPTTQMTTPKPIPDERTPNQKRLDGILEQNWLIIRELKQLNENMQQLLKLAEPKQRKTNAKQT